MNLSPILKLNSSSAIETKRYGELFSKVLAAGDLVVLVGALGGGKTTFTKGILKGLGYRSRVLSPSFTLVREYSTKRLKAYHVDLYRLDKSEVSSLGLDDFIYSCDSLTLIEWGDRIVKELDKYIIVKFSYLAQTKRQLLISALGYSNQRVKGLKGFINK